MYANIRVPPPPPPPPRPLGFASDYWAVKNVRMLLIMFLKIYIFLRITQVLLETISRKMFYYRVVRVIPH